MHIALVIGTARIERQSEKVAVAIGNLLEAAAGVTFDVVDVRDHVAVAVTVPSWGVDGAGTKPTQWQQIAKQADGFIFILPEYNHSFPGEWKLLVDSLGPHEYGGKPAYVVGVSGGSFGGARVIDHVKPVLVELGFRVMKSALYVANVSKQFTPEGDYTDQTTQKRFTDFVDEVSKTT